MTQQVVVLVHGADRTVRDVTPICYYDSSNPTIAEVDPDGYVRFKTRGEVADHRPLPQPRGQHPADPPGRSARIRPGRRSPRTTSIDRAVFAKLNQMRIRPSELCTDREFIRRVYLDVLGVLPTPEEVKAIPGRPAGRTAAITVVERLLERPEFYDFWALKFADVFRSNGRLIQTKGAYAFHRWIREILERNVPMDQFVRSLLTSEGSTFRNPAANYYRISRDPENCRRDDGAALPGRAHPVCQVPQPSRSSAGPRTTTTGSRPSSRRSAARRATCPTRRSSTPPARATSASRAPAQTMKPKALGGPVLDDPAAQDRRVRLAAWLSSPDNPFFAKSLVNRIWFHLLGRGIVEPVDDFRDSNPASNDELLDGLTAEFVKNGYDLKKLIRSILHSRTYQFSATDQSAERRRLPLLLPRPDQAAAGRGAARRDLGRDRHDHRL